MRNVDLNKYAPSLINGGFIHHLALRDCALMWEEAPLGALAKQNVALPREMGIR